MKKSIILPSLAGCASVVAFFLRKSQLALAKNPETLLYTDNAPETMALCAFLLFCVVALAGVLFTGGRPLPNYTYATYCPKQLFLFFVGGGSLLMMLSIIVGVIDILGGTRSANGFPATFACKIVIVALVGIVMLYLGKLAYEGKELRDCWLTTVPAFLAVLRLMEEYRGNAAQPNVLDSFFPIFATMSLTMALYHLSASAYLQARPRAVVFFSLTSVLLTGVVLASDLGVYDTMIYVAFNSYMLAFSGAILENTYASRENYRTPPPPKGESFYTNKEQKS